MKKSDAINNIAKQAMNNMTISSDEKKRLLLAREQALNTPKSSFIVSLSAPIMAYASVFLVVGLISFSLFNKTPDTAINSMPIHDEFALMNSQDAVELYQDLEFFMWLDIKGVALEG